MDHQADTDNTAEVDDLPTHDVAGGESENRDAIGQDDGNQHDGNQDDGNQDDGAAPEAAEPGDEEDREAEAGSGSGRVAALEREGDIAADYLEELLDIADLDGDIDMDVDGDRAVVSIVGADLSQLVGRDGEVLDALQDLTRLAVLRETGDRSRLMLDISGHREKRREELRAQALEAVNQARESGSPVSLPAMSAFERKVVHDAVAAQGLESESEGMEPRRFVVVQAP